MGPEELLEDEAEDYAEDVGPTDWDAGAGGDATGGDNWGEGDATGGDDNWNEGAAAPATGDDNWNDAAATTEAVPPATAEPAAASGWDGATTDAPAACGGDWSAGGADAA